MKESDVSYFHDGLNEPFLSFAVVVDEEGGLVYLKYAGELLYEFGKTTPDYEAEKFKVALDSILMFYPALSNLDY